MADRFAAATFSRRQPRDGAPKARPHHLGDVAHRGCSVISVEPFAQAVPLRGVMAANDFCARGFDTANFSE
jgi:hypothetical protein